MAQKGFLEAELEAGLCWGRGPRRKGWGGGMRQGRGWVVPLRALLREGPPWRTLWSSGGQSWGGWDPATLGQVDLPPGWFSREGAPVSSRPSTFMAAGEWPHQPRSHLGRQPASNWEPEHSTQTQAILGTPCRREGARLHSRPSSCEEACGGSMCLLHILMSGQSGVGMVSFTSHWSTFYSHGKRRPMLEISS